MSQPANQGNARKSSSSRSRPSRAMPANQRGKTWPCALVGGIDRSGAFIAASPALIENDCKLSARLVQMRRRVEIWNGIEIAIPLGNPIKQQKTNNQSGFDAADKHSLEQCNDRIIQIEFPRGQYTVECSRPPPAIQQRLGSKDGKLCLLTVRLAPGVNATIRGYGLPFANGDDDEVDKFVNKDQPMTYAPGVTFLSLLTQRVFHIFIPFPPELHHLEDVMGAHTMPPPFDYPYGTDHTWNMERYDQQLRVAEFKGADAYPAAAFFRDDNSRVAVLAQSAVQETWWIAEVSNFIASHSFASYCVKTGNRSYYVVVLMQSFRDLHDVVDAWPFLVKTRDIKMRLRLKGPEGGQDRVYTWDCVIEQHPSEVAELSQHPVSPTDVVLRVRVPEEDKAVAESDLPAMTLKNRSAANLAFKNNKLPSKVAVKFDVDLNDCRRLVKAACDFLPDATRTNNYGGNDLDTPRCLVRGVGFFDVLVKPRLDSLEGGMPSLSLTSTVPSLRVVNLLAGLKHTRYRAAIFNQILEHDRKPVESHLSRAPLGLVAIAAAPGFGKTSLVAAAGLALQASFGKVLCSGPSNAAIDNLAVRLNRLSIEACDEANQGLNSKNPYRIRRPLVVRVFNMKTEIKALRGILNGARPDTLDLGVHTKWSLPLSPTFWLLVLIGHKGPDRRMHEDDSTGLRKIYEELRRDRSVACIGEVMGGKIQMKDISPDVKEQAFKTLARYLHQVVDIADFLCATPAMFGKDSNAGGQMEWKKDRTRAVLVDEAASIHLNKFLWVWGNCGLPCIMCGDPTQPRPTIMSDNKKDSDGFVRNRVGRDAAISGLMAVGWPVYTCSQPKAVHRSK
ncbi:hypothetical protein QBC43DRAFT_334620 [Cladorrhinum sp. PSN259]|nr:hypothetical protein QBC43DRAFT_334620 [Cladorrhinum sp. PSN259]